MQYFDLNIPYLEDKATPDRAAKKQNRLKLAVKAAELGYSGVAYNRMIKGVMSESDRCSIPPFPLSSLLKLSPSLFSIVSFHRSLLGAGPADSPFRQYTRLTVSIETPAQASALNSGNPILKTYDLVAARPLNQSAFDQACQFSEVDLIAIDFSEKLPFRLKLPMVKAAITRGVYFEIAYSSLLEGVQVRRQVISNAKLLVEWTRGKNLIISSAATSVLEFRGPNDVANLSYFLGLSTELAKAALSRNCRSLMTNALKKKKFYKEAVRVEPMPSTAQFGSKDPWNIGSFDWDPISSDEGDLCLDDLAKLFSSSGKVSKTAKAVDFSSFVDNMASQGLQTKDVELRVMASSHPSNNTERFKEFPLSRHTESTLSEHPSNSSEDSEKLPDAVNEDNVGLRATDTSQQSNGIESFETFRSEDTEMASSPFINENASLDTTLLEHPSDASKDPEKLPDAVNEKDVGLRASNTSHLSDYTESCKEFSLSRQTDTNFSPLINETVLLNNTHLENPSDVFEDSAKVMVQGEGLGQVEDFGKAKYSSLDETKSVYGKVKRRVPSQAVRLPLKRVLQVPFKKNGMAYAHKAKKKRM